MNEILQEIYRVREEHARECAYDVDVMFLRMKEDLKRLEAEGWKIVSPGAPVAAETADLLREEPRKRNNGR
ncbi:MAG: hypothetical protein ABSG04_14570 [Verrucomicrobiota bacterium]|jgi:hypothetical protein